MHASFLIVMSFPNVEHNNAYFRRFLIVPFEVTIPEDQQDKELSKKIIKDELSGVFNWVLRGLDRLLSQRGFTKSKPIENAVQSYRKDADTVQVFLEDEGYQPSITNKITLKEFYSIYANYCNNSGYKYLNKKNF